MTAAAGAVRGFLRVYCVSSLHKSGYQEMRLGSFPHVPNGMRLSTGEAAIHRGVVQCWRRGGDAVEGVGRGRGLAVGCRGIMQVFLTWIARPGQAADAGLEISCATGH